MTIQKFSAILHFMIIEQADSADLPRIMKIYHDCTAVLQELGIHQWSERYPNREIIEEDIRLGYSYIARDEAGEIIGVIVIEQNSPDEAHEEIIWSQNEDPSVFLSRLAVTPEQQGNGIGTMLFEFGERLALSKGAGSIRLDADVQNKRLVQMYTSREYSVQGSVWYDDPPKEFYAMEKRIPKIDIHWASDEDLPIILDIRNKVFIEGQQVSRDLEQDGLDDQAKHVILYENKVAVGGARIRWMSMELEGTETKTLVYWKVERLAVLEQARNKGYGKLIMEWIISKAQDQQLEGLTLHAQKYLETFYKSLGFKPEGKPFMEAGIQHITMSRTLGIAGKHKA